MENSSLKGIGHFIFVGSSAEFEGFGKLIEKIELNNVQIGGVSRNQNLEEILDTLFLRWFPQQDFTEQELKNYPALKPLPSTFDYNKFKALVVFVKSYSSGHPKYILTNDRHPSIALAINDLFWLMTRDNNLRKIPKLFFIDASTYASVWNGLAYWPPPKLYIELPPDLDKIFIASVSKTKTQGDPLRFFSKLVDKLEEKSHKSFRELFEVVQEELKADLVIETIDHLGDDLILPN